MLYRYKKGVRKMANYAAFRFSNDRYLILRTIKTYSRTASGKSWKSKPDEIECEIQKPEWYENYITSIPFFNNFGYGASCRGQYSYTMAGYIPTEVTSISPGQTTKKVAEFEFIYKPEMEEQAGWREKEVLQKATMFEIEAYKEYYNQHYPTYGKRITLINPKESGVTHSAIWDTGKRRWVD